MTLCSGVKKSSLTTNPNKGTAKRNIKGRNGFGKSSRAGVVGEYVVVEETETGVRRGRHRKGKRACGVEVRIYREVMKEEHEEEEVVLESVEDARGKGGGGDGKGKEKGNGESSEMDWNDDDVHGKAEVRIGDGETSEMDWNDEDVGAKVEVEICDFKDPEMITGERLGSEGVLLVEDSEPRNVSVTAQRTLEENTGTQGLTHEKSASTFNRFLDLPPEIRFMIYEYLLVVGKVFPHPKPRHDVRYSGWQEYEKPMTQLFGVCRRVKEECEK
ncbi:MAG: hypothetical protein M1830_002599, partial [Pleopsidium flavum]